MTLLIDTHALLWFVAGDRRLSPGARAAMQRDDAQLVISAASVWEMAIKTARGRLELPLSVDRYISDRLEEGYVMLRVDWIHAAAVAGLGRHHDDPFDRLLIAQSLAERLPIVTRDRVFRKYGAEVVW